MRPLPIAPLLAVTAVAVGCGASSDRPAAPGSPQHPLVATVADTPPAGKAGAPAFKEAESAGSATPADAGPSYEKLLAQQSSKPQSRFTPCNLVTRAEAATIIQGAVRPLTEAPQGPTCIYRSVRTRHGRQFITVAVQTTPFATVRRHVKQPTAITVGGRSGLCGTWGQPALYVPLSKGRVLSITGHCDVARRFAAKAVPRLPS
jgi:hypothetical protein